MWYKNKWIIGGAVLFALIIGYTIYSNTRPQTYLTTPVQRGDIREEVSITGKVKPAQNLDIAFEKGGRITKIRVQVGDVVKQGQELMVLENADLYAQLAQARANLHAQEVKLEQLRLGARQEDLAISQSRVSNAQTTLADAERNLANITEKARIDLENTYGSVADILTDAYAKSDDAIRNKIDALFNNDDTDRPTLSFISFDSQAKIDSEEGRVRSTVALAAFSQNVSRSFVEGVHLVSVQIVATCMLNPEASVTYPLISSLDLRLRPCLTSCSMRKGTNCQPS